MKKTLVAIAALTAVSAFAQSSVTIYGKEDISYGKIKTDHYTATKDVKSTALADSAVESSRIGFKGVEDLGSGMTAGFTLESGLNLTGGTTFAKAASGANLTSDGATNSSSIFGAATRQALVSVGSTTLGNLSVGYKKQAELDAVETNIQNTVNSAGGSAIKDNRLDRANGLYYVSPTMSGIYATVQYTAGKTAYDDATTALAKNAEVKLTSLTLNYAQGPLTAVAHTGSGKITVGSAAASTTQLVDGTLSSGANASVFSVSGQNKYDTTVIGAAYDFGVAKVNALSGTRKVGVESAATFQDSKYTNMGVSAPVGQWLLIAAHEKRTTDKNAGARDDEMASNQFIAKYNMSKRTYAYGLYGSDKTKTPSQTDIKTTSTRVGLVHNF